MPVDAELWRAAFPRYWAAPADIDFGAETQPWNSFELAHWFAATAPHYGLQVTKKSPAVGAKWGLFGSRPVRGWRFLAPTWHIQNTADRPSPDWDDVGVTADGKIVGNNKVIGVLGLQQMAGLLGADDPRLVWDLSKP